MSIAQALLPEWENEMRNTRRVLERVAADNMGYRPHEKSWTLGELASHIARLPSWVTTALTTDELDLEGTPPNEAFASTDSMLEEFDRNAAQGAQAIASTGDAQFGSPWTLKQSGRVLFTMPKVVVLRSFTLNHIIHHRGQLTVYLRMTDTKVPGMYGPSADEAM